MAAPLQRCQTLKRHVSLQQLRHAHRDPVAAAAVPLLPLPLLLLLLQPQVPLLLQPRGQVLRELRVEDLGGVCGGVGWRSGRRLGTLVVECQGFLCARMAGTLGFPA